jgi:transposase-like protein
METEKIANQMISFQRTLFDSSFNAVKMAQDQTEKMANSFMDKLSWIPEDGKKVVTDSADFYKKARDDFKKSVDDGFTRMEEMFARK